MYRDDRLEYKKGSLSVKKTETAVNTEEDGKPIQKLKRSTKFDFSGTNYEIETFGYLAGIEQEYELDPNLFKRICENAKKASGARKPAGGDREIEDKFASIRSDPAFLARTSLRAKISGRAIFKTENTPVKSSREDEFKVGDGGEPEVVAGASGGDEPEVKDGEDAGLGCEPDASVAGTSEVSDELTTVVSDEEEEVEEPSEEVYPLTEDGEGN